MDTQKNIDVATRYLRALEQRSSPADLFHPDVVVEVFPNRLDPAGSRSTLPQVVAAAELGRKLLSWQSYRILNTIAAGDTVVLEVAWTGRLALTHGALREGQELRARFACILELRDGLIHRQRNYDCYEPW